MAEIATTPQPAPSDSWLNRLSPQAVFLIVAGFFGLAMVFVTPPIQAPDEPHHWFRVYQLSKGKMLADTLYQLADGRVVEPKRYKASDGEIAFNIYGGQVPNAVNDSANQFAAVPFHPENKTSIAQIQSEFKRPLQPRLTHFEDFSNTALYTVVPYLPQTLAMLIARKLHWPTLGLLYAGRVGTVLGYLLIGWWAIRITPILKWPACLVLASPMALFLAASLSADPITTAVCFLAIAIALRCILSSVPLGTGDIVMLALAMIAVALCKPAYFPIAFLAFAIPRKNWRTRNQRWIMPILILLLTVGFFEGWSALSGAFHVKERGDGPHIQLNWILHHKIDYLKVLRTTVTAHTGEVAISAVGNLGWIDTPLLPGVIYFLYFALMWITLAYDEQLKLRIWPRAVAAVALLASVGFIITANYMVWCEIGHFEVEGLQGRYFLPIALLACMIVRRKGVYTVQPKWMLALMSAISLYTIWVLIERYYLPAGILGGFLSGTPLPT